MSVTVDGRPIEYGLLPPHLRDGMMRWIEHGIKPGSFLSAVLMNNFTEAIGVADTDSRLALQSIVQFIRWEMPVGSHGSREVCASWAANHGRSWR